MNYNQIVTWTAFATKLETEKDNWKPSHWTTLEQGWKQGDKSANCWWDVSVGLLLNKVANCLTLLHANRSQWPSHIRIAAGLSVRLPTFVKIIHIQQTSLSRWYYICNIFWSVFISIHRNFVFSKQIVVNSIDWFVWVYLQWIWNGFWEFLCLYMEGHSIASLLFYSLDRTMGCHELIILIRSSGNALCFRCWEYSAAPLAPSPVFLSALIKFSDAKTKTSSSSTSFLLSFYARFSNQGNPGSPLFQMQQCKDKDI